MALIDVNRDGIAIDGFDPVSYFEGEPLRGKSEFSFELDGAVYYFANTENMEKFAEDPARFIPAYGGYCAYEMSRGQIKKGNPDSYMLNSGKLYFFYRDNLQDALVSPENQMPDYLLQADENWAQYNSENPAIEFQNLSDAMN